MADILIRPAYEREYISIPNELLNDRRLSAETRLMIAMILSKPRSWEIRSKPLAKALSREGENAIGNTKMRRMFREAREAGYMARTLHQNRDENGKWGRFSYYVGMPQDVEAAVERDNVAILPQARNPLAADPLTDQPCTANAIRSQKEQSQENTDFKNYPLKISPLNGDVQHAAKVEYTAMGRAALSQSMQFVYERSKPFNAWLKFRGVDGMPPIDEVVIEGARRRGVWMPTLYPPHRDRQIECQL